jgi:hypothetical protein
MWEVMPCNRLAEMPTSSGATQGRQAIDVHGLPFGRVNKLSEGLKGFLQHPGGRQIAFGQGGRNREGLTRASGFEVQNITSLIGRGNGAFGFGGDADDAGNQLFVGGQFAPSIIYVIF